MSSLHDPFDLIRTGQDMDNVVPFLAPSKVSSMIDAALAEPQLAPQKPATFGFWKYGGVAVAACLALFMVFLTPAPQTKVESNTSTVAQASTEDVNEFTELVMLETWERY